MLALVLLAVQATAGQDAATSVPPSATSTAAAASPGPTAAFPVGFTFDLQEWRDLPSSHGIFSIFETVEATAITDRIGNGGLYTGEPALLGLHGSSWTQVSYRIGDLEITDPTQLGTPLFLPDLLGLGTLNVVSGLMPAEDAGPGSVVRLGMRRPGNAWHGSLGGDFVPVSWQSAPPPGPPAIARYASFGSGRFRLDGPLVENRLGVLLSGALTEAGWLERNDPTRLVGREASGLAELVWTASSRDEVRFLGALQGTAHPYGGRARFGTMDVGENDDLLTVQSTWERRGSRPWTLTGGYVRGAFDPDLAGLSPRGAVERLRDGPIARLFPATATSERANLAARAMPKTKALAGGSHTVRFGLATTWTRASTRPAGTPGLTPETVDGLPARVWAYGWAGPESKWRGFDLAAYAADAVTYGPASFDLGLRFESTSASAEAGSGRIVWSGLAPRLSGRVRLLHGLSFFGGYARYRNRLPLNLLAYGDPTAAQGVLYRWEDHNHDEAFQPDELGPLIARAGPGGPFASIDPELKAPHTDELVAGLDFRLGHDWTGHFLGIRRRESGLMAPINIGAPLSAYTVSYVPDPGGDILGPADDQLLPIYDRRPESFGQDEILLTNTSERALHEGAELEVQASIGDRLRLRFGATASRSSGPGANRGFKVVENDQGLTGERLLDPNADTFADGRTFFDRAFTIKIAASYRAPGDAQIGLVARYQDGQPFARLVIAPLLNQGPEAVQAIPNGRSRFTFTMTVDARIEKGFRIRAARLAALAEAFNLLNSALEVEEDVVTGPAFRSVTAVQPPRAVRLGVRLDF